MPANETTTDVTKLDARLAVARNAGVQADHAHDVARSNLIEAERTWDAALAARSAVR